MKRLFLFSAFILCSLATMAGDFEVDGICYNITSTNNLLTVEVTSSSSDYSGDIVIPRQVEYDGNTYSVTSIGEEAFERCSGFTSVAIPNSVTSIGESAFEGCYDLQKVIVEDIAAWCNISFDGIYSNPLNFAHHLYLNGQEVKDLVIPNSVTSIGNYAFYGCSYLGFVTIPNSVTSIGYKAFYDCRSVREVTIPSSVTSIGKQAFSGVWSDTYFIVEEGNTKYDSRDNCNALIETSTNTLIAGFENTVIPNSVTSIGDYAFYDCSGLKEVTIPNSVTSIGEYAFSVCSGLQKVIVEDIAAWCNISFDGSDSNPLSYAHHLYLNGQEVKDLVIPSSMTSIGNYAFYGCFGLISATIPNSVTSIGNSAFSGCSGLTSVTIPNSVTSIGNFAFSDCNSLTSVTIPNSVTSIGESAFSGCSGLTEVTIGNSVTSIGDGAFSGCSNVTEVTIPNSVTSIGKSAFSGCSGLTEITIGNSVTSIGDMAFYNCSGLTSVTIGNSVTSIGYRVFSGCSGLTEVTIGNSVTSIKSEAFYNCSGLTSVTIPNTVTSIGYRAFSGCSGLTSVKISDLAAWCNINFGGISAIDNGNPLYYAHHLYLNGQEVKDLVIPNSVTSIGEYAFSGCSGLTSVTIPSSVTSIESAVFSGCNGLTSVKVGMETPLSISSSTFSNRANATLYVPVGSKAAYQAANYWKEFKEIVEYGDITFADANVKAICVQNWDTDGDGELSLSEAAAVTSLWGFGKNTTLTSFDELQYFTGLTSIEKSVFFGDGVFEGCSGLTEVTIPNSVTSIGDDAFSGCSGLTEVTIPNSVTSIEKYAFGGCSGLTEVSIPNSVTSIGDGAFQGCSGLTEVTIGNSVTNIGQVAFDNCSSLISVHISDLSAWCNINFGEDTANPLFNAHHLYLNGQEVKDLVIPNNVTSIGNRAFAGCSGLISVTIPNSVTSIGHYAFNDCSGLTEVTVGNSVASIGNGAFQGCSGLTEVTIPNSVTSIGDGAFSGCSSLTEVTIGNSVTSTGSQTFEDCSCLTSVTIGNSVTSIGHRAFSGCTGLTEVTIPNSVTYIDGSAFSGCSGLTSVTIPNSVTYIGSYAFSGCSGLTEVTIPNSVTRINYNAFSGCSGLTSVTIPSSVTSIENAVFSGCSGLTSVTIPNSVTSIGSYAFGGCSGLTEVAIPNSVTSIGDSAFKGCRGLTSVIIPNSVTSIERYAFNGCSGLTEVTIPNSVTSIGWYAFNNFTSQTSVKVDKEEPLSIDSYTFYNCTNATLYVPKGSKAAYQSANNWKNFKAIVEFPDADVNQDEEIDVVDVVDIARFVVGMPGDTFVKFLADLNSDGEVNVADAVVLVNEIAGDVNFAKPYGAPRQDLGDDRLTLTENDNHSISFAMESQRPYTAFQFDLYTNSEDDVMNLRLNTARKNGHQLLYNKVDEGHYRVVALSVANNGFNGNNGELLNIQLDGFNSADMTIGNIHFITTDGTDHRFDDLSLSGATGIESLTPNPSPKGEGNIYDLSGRKVSESSVLPKGIYIVNGKKVIVK